MMGRMVNPPVEELMEELRGCSDADLDGRVRALELERRRVDAELALAAAEVDRRRCYLDDGHRTLRAYLRATCNASDAEAARVARLAAGSAVPGLAEALHAGRIGTPQAGEIAAAHANPRIRRQLVEFAPTLLDLAERLSFREFRTCVRRFVMLADLDGAHRELDASVANRRVHVVNVNGELHVDAAGGDPLVNVELEAIFRRFCDLEYEADLAARRAEYGELAEHHPLPRTAAQRGYDAFVAVMRGALANHEAHRPGHDSSPLVTVLTDHRTFATMLAEAGLAPDTNLAGETVDPFTGLASPSDLLADLMADPDSFATRRCETSTGQLLHPHAVLRAALAGHVRRAVLGADSVPINLGRKVRVFTGAARDAAKLLAVQCDHLGCGMPADMCEVDHSVDWSDDGRTDQDNAGVQCGGHNRLKHRRRWRTRRDIHGRIHTIRPDGSIMLPVGARPPTFPDELPPPIVRALERWTTAAPDDVESRCRTLRAAAIRHAATHGDEIDLEVLEKSQR
jgi:hypothetical protein